MSEEPAVQLSSLEKAAIWSFLGVAAISAATALIAGRFDEAVTSIGVFLIFCWLKLNVWFLKEKTFETNLFAEADFKASELLFAGVLLALLPAGMQLL